jgi:hypothetical protein
MEWQNRMYKKRDGAILDSNLMEMFSFTHVMQS